MQLQRAYSVLSLKSASESEDGKTRKLSGIASTPSTDRMGDIVEPKGAEFKLPLPLLWQHDSRQPIGWVTSAKVTGAGIEIAAEIATVQEDGALKSRIDEAWQSIKLGLVKGLSIGFQALETAAIEGTWGVRFIKWAWLELSAVTIPANAEASITSVKAADLAAIRAATGAASGPRVVRLKDGGEARQPLRLPGATGHANSPQGAPDVKITEQLAAFDARRKSAVGRMGEIMEKAGEEGRSLDETEQQEYDGLGADVAQIDGHIGRLKQHEQFMLANAKPVTPDTAAPAGTSVQLGNGPISVQRNLPKGTAFTRYAMALAVSKGNLWQAEKLSAQWKDTPEVGLVLRAAADAGTTSDTTWAAPLVQYQDMVGEFIELLRNATIIGRLNSVRRVPFNVRIPRQTSGSTGSFVGEGSPTPVRELAFDNVTLPWAKASAIIVITAELARLSQPSAEALVRTDLINGIAEFLDKRLVDPAYPGVANTSPASLTNGVTARQASGATLAAIDADVKYIMQQYVSANLGLSSGIWVMSPTLAITLSMLRTNQDTPAFPGMTLNGGTFYGLPAITSNSVAPSGSPGDQHLILINQNEVLLADDGQMMIDASMEASLQMDNAPSAGAQSLVSLWQNGLMGVKVDRWIYWTKRRSQAVQFIDKAQSYGS